jgi:hypothetical protein
MVDRLAATGIPQTIHHLAEMLLPLVPINPKRIFLQFAALVESGKNGRH